MAQTRQSGTTLADAVPSGRVTLVGEADPVPAQEASQGQTWRPRLIGRVAFLLLGLSFLGLAVLALVSGFATSDRSAFVAVPLAAAWGVPLLLSTRMRITLCDDVLEYRNFGGVRRIQLGQIRGASAGYCGMTLQLAEQDEFRQPKHVVAMAVQKSNLAGWLGWNTRGDRLAELILDRSGGAADSHAVPEP